MFEGFPELNKILPLAVRRDWRSEVAHLELICLIVWFEGDDQSSAGHKGGKGQRLSLRPGFSTTVYVTSEP